MAGICTATVSPNACGHRSVTVNLDGQSVVLELHENDLLPLTTEEREALVRLALRRLKAVTGVTLAQLLNRVVQGDEATNVKAYTLFGPGILITKSNIGTAYVNILTEANGGRALIDFTGGTQFRLIGNTNFPATALGPLGVRLVRDGDNAVLYENALIAATPSGERELDSNWQSLPVWATGQELIRAQAKSVTAGDDPVFKRVVLLVR